LQQVYQFLGVASDPDIKPETIFSGDYSAARDGFGRLLIKKYLALRFYFANRQLKKILLQVGCSPDWPWLR
jgi:hypothetical protein